MPFSKPKLFNHQSPSEDALENKKKEKKENRLFIRGSRDNLFGELSIKTDIHKKIRNKPNSKIKDSLPAIHISCPPKKYKKRKNSSDEEEEEVETKTKKKKKISKKNYSESEEESESDEKSRKKSKKKNKKEYESDEEEEEIDKEKKKAKIKLSNNNIIIRNRIPNKNPR